jgi:hypothetical protein
MKLFIFGYIRFDGIRVVCTTADGGSRFSSRCKSASDHPSRAQEGGSSSSGSAEPDETPFVDT